ncbi:MAG: glycosyltransferase [Paludibacteraceae bacterium]|nr:glycosyltransferase [Paludibacteraceae bacterium]
MSKILFISDAHTPPLYCVRARFFADYLTRQGHSVMFVSERYDDECDCDSVESPTYLHKPVGVYSSNPLARVIKRTFVWLADMVLPCKERIFTRGVRKAIAGQMFDVVICSTFHSFPLLTAQTIAREHNAKLMVDVRDMAEQMHGYVYHEFHPRVLHWLFSLKHKAEIHRRNSVLRTADALTTVSPWHVEQLRQYNPHVTLVYNGYNEGFVVPRALCQKRFEIVYLGKFYGEPLQCVDRFFEVVGKMVSAEDMDINIVFYTDEASRSRLSEHIPQVLADRISFEGYVPRNQVYTVLSEASAALVLTNKERPEGPHGMMTTKFFEALGAGTPVLCTRSDGSYLATLVNSTHAGVTDDDLQEFEEYIRRLYRQWQASGITTADVADEVRVEYSRQQQAAKLNSIIDGFSK